MSLKGKPQHSLGFSFPLSLISILGIKKFHISTSTSAIILKIQIKKKYFLFFSIFSHFLGDQTVQQIQRNVISSSKLSQEKGKNKEKTFLYMHIHFPLCPVHHFPLSLLQVPLSQLVLSHKPISRVHINPRKQHDQPIGHIKHLTTATVQTNKKLKKTAKRVYRQWLLLRFGQCTDGGSRVDFCFRQCRPRLDRCLLR